MTIERKKQVYGAGLLITAGLGTLLGRYVGFEYIWFLYPLAVGILMMVAPWVTGEEQIRNTRIVGAWMATGGVVSGLVTLGGLEWATVSPLWMVGAGLTALFWKKQVA